MKTHTQLVKHCFATLLFFTLVLVFSIHPAGTIFKTQGENAHEN